MKATGVNPLDWMIAEGKARSWLDHRLPLEYCDDCGAPLYPNPDGEPVHAELPEEEASVPRHLH